MAKKKKKNAKRQSATRFICTNCGEAAALENFTPGEILFCEACGGSLVSPEKAPPPRQRDFGKYRILGEIGKGGMGIVYRAVHKTLESEVALKVLLPAEGTNPKMIAWLLREAQAASKLRHPNIVSVHDVDEFEGEHYIAMDYIEGQSMDVAIRKPLKPRKAASLLRGVADASHYAHEKGIIHRDIKPANILLDHRNVPHVMDFGIARDIRGDRQGPASGSVVGTPGYMSPEQARGEDDIDRRSDVYSLGAVLFFLLTGHASVEAGDTQAAVKSVARGESPDTEDFPRNVPADLVAICLKALAPGREERYKSARLLAEDLDRFLRGDPTLAASHSSFALLMRGIVRYRLLVAIGSVGLIAVIVLLAVVAFSPDVDKERLAKVRRELERIQKKKDAEALKERERLEKEMERKEYANLKQRLIEKVDLIKEMARTKYEAMAKTFNQDPEQTLKDIDDVESDLRSLDTILKKMSKGRSELLKKLKQDQEVADTLYVKQDFPRLEDLRAKCYHILGWLQWQNKLDADKAVQYYNLALQLSPRVIEFFKWRGIVQFEAERFKLADHDLTMAMGNDPAMAVDPFLIKYAIETKARLGFFGAIDELLEKIPAQSWDRLYIEGLTAHYKKEWPVALAKFQAAISKNMTLPDAHVMLGVTHFAAGDFSKAIEKFGQIASFANLFNIKKDPARSARDNMILNRPLARVHYYLGRSRLAAAEKAQNATDETRSLAAADFRRALEIMPTYAPAKEWLARVVK